LAEAGLLAAADLACIRGGRTVFAGVGFALAAGEALVLRGANGSGKSSLLRVLAGFLRPAAGRLAWAGAPIPAQLPEHRARLHYVGHADGIKSLLTVRENLAIASLLASAKADGVEGALAGFDLAALATTPARFLSSGQRRRLALARLLAAPRPLWLLDEPGVGLDAANRARLEAVIAVHRRAGGLVVAATHGDVALEAPLVMDFDA
jgi:heme exporter protein A